MRFLIFFLFCPLLVFASLEKKLENFYQKMGSSVHINKESIYHRQAGGYNSAGGISIRNNVHDQKLFHFDPPRIDAGCGGIDIHMGGFSFIKEEEFVASLKNIGSNALGYAFMLGLQTVAPSIANTMGILQSFANDVNAIGINSCETAMQLVGGALSLSETANEQNCRKLGSKQGMFSDYLQGRKECSANLDRNKVQQMESKALSEGILVGPLNLSWQAMKKYAFLSNDPQTAEMLMTLFGSVLTNRLKGQTELRTTVLRSMGLDEDFLTKFLRGGALPFYRCDEHEKCLSVRIKESAAFKSWFDQVRARLEAIYEKVLKDEELSDAEKELIRNTRFPIYRLINVIAAGNMGLEELFYLVDIIAKEALITFVREMKGHLEVGLEEIKQRKLYENEKDIENFEDGLKRLEQVLYQYEIKNSEEKQLQENIIAQIERIERSILNEVFMD